jgi:hypothetical protein
MDPQQGKPTCASPKCRPSKSGGIVSRPSLNFEPTFDQELLWMTHACPQADPLDSMPLTSEGRTDIYKDGRKGRRPRLPDRNGEAPAQRLRSEFGTPGFPFLVQDACGPRDGRRRTRKAGASAAARSEQSHGRAARDGSSHSALGDTILPGTFERGPHGVYLQGSNGRRELCPVLRIPVMDQNLGAAPKGNAARNCWSDAS